MMIDVYEMPEIVEIRLPEMDIESQEIDSIRRILQRDDKVIYPIIIARGKVSILYHPALLNPAYVTSSVCTMITE